MSDEEGDLARSYIAGALLGAFILSVSVAGYLVAPALGFLAFGLACLVVGLLYAMSE